MADSKYAVNPKTGEVAEYNGQAWQPVEKDRVARNKAGDISVFNGADWLPVGSIAAPAEPEPAPAAPAPTTGDQALQIAGQGARSILKGASYPVTAAGDIAATGMNLAAKGINAAAGTDLPMTQLPGDWANGILNANFPKPQTPTQEIASKMTTAAASVPGTAAALVGTGARALAPMAEGIGAQIAGAATGAGSGAAVHEAAPESPWLEFLATLAGGAVGGLGAGAASTRTAVNPEAAARLGAFERSNITPSAADVTQSKPMQTIKNALSSVPFVGRIVQNADEAQVNQAQQSAAALANRYGTPDSPAGIGATVQNAVERYRYGDAPAGMTASDILRSPTSASSIAAKAGALYDRVPIAPGTDVPITNTMAALDGILGRFNNPALAAERADPTIARWQALLERSGGQLTWNDLRQLRTDVRYLRNKPNLAATIDDRALGQLNDALSQDMVAGAQTLGGPRAAQLVSRADDYYGRAMTRINDSLQKVFDAPTPESAYGQVETALLAGRRGDIGKVSALRRALTDEEWGDVAATVLDRMGAKTPSQMPAPGSGAPNFSANTFLTKYSQMDPASRSLLFSGSGRSDLRDSLDDLTRAVGAMKGTASKGNPSGTMSMGVATGMGAGAMTAPTLTAALMGLSYLSARAMYNPTFVRLMTRTLTAQSPRMQANAVQSLTNFARQQPDLQGDVDAFLKGLGGGQDRSEKATATAP